MNPFLHDPVARPLSIRPKGSWRFPFSPQRQCVRLSRQAGVLALAAGVGAGMGVSTNAHAIDVNTASPTQLQSVKGVGPRTAQVIVQERIRAGHFESLEDLSDRVRGIGVKKLQAMQAGGLRVGGSTESKYPDSGDAKLVFSSVHPVATPAVMEIPETTGSKP